MLALVLFVEVLVNDALPTLACHGLGNHHWVEQPGQVVVRASVRLVVDLSFEVRHLLHLEQVAGIACARLCLTVAVRHLELLLAGQAGHQARLPAVAVRDVVRCHEVVQVNRVVRQRRLQHFKRELLLHTVRQRFIHPHRLHHRADSAAQLLDVVVVLNLA